MRSSPAARTEEHRQGGRDSRTCISRPWRLEVQDRGSGEPLPGLWATFSLCPPPMAERDLSSSSYKAMSCQLRTLFTHNYLLEILLPETVPLGLGLQHVDFGDKAQTTHSALGEGTLHDTSLTPNV